MMVPAVRGQTQSDPASPDLRIHQGLDVEIRTEAGRVYSVEGSRDGMAWIEMVGGLFGDGNLLRLSLRQDGSRLDFPQYRLRSESSAGIGIAPASLVGRTVLCNEGPAFEMAAFLDDSSGWRRRGWNPPEPFTYDYVKSGASSGRAVIALSAGGEVLEVNFDFSTGTTGGFTREELKYGKLDNTDTGTFHFAETDVLHTGMALPGLASRILTFHDGAAVRTLEFLTDSSGQIINADGTFTSFSYAYTVKGSDALFTVSEPGAPPGTFEEITVHFSSTNCGRFTRREFKESLLKDSESGAFSATGPSPAPSCLAPASIEGRSFECDVSGHGFALNFKIRSAGSRVERHYNSGGQTVEVTPFSYTYQKTGSTTGKITITYPGSAGDDILDYEMTFTGPGAGDFTMREKEDGEVVETKNGTFALADDAASAPGG